MKKLLEFINEEKGDNIDDQWLNDDKPVMTYDGRPAIITNIDYAQVPNMIYGKVKMKDSLFDFIWYENGECYKAVDLYGNPKVVDKNDNLVKSI